MLAAAAAMAREVPLELTLVRAQTIAHEQIAPLLAASPLPVRVVESDERFAVIAASHLALCASGTATLEVGLLRTPLLVLYRLHRWTYWLGRLLVRLPWFSLVNLVLDEKAVPELLQHAATPERVAAEALRLLRDEPARELMRRRLGGLRARLGEGGASRRAAASVAELLPPVRVSASRVEASA
jgi:lipid-A-disaccharide synthase